MSYFSVDNSFSISIKVIEDGKSYSERCERTFLQYHLHIFPKTNFWFLMHYSRLPSPLFQDQGKILYIINTFNLKTSVNYKWWDVCNMIYFFILSLFPLMSILKFWIGDSGCAIQWQKICLVCARPWVPSQLHFRKLRYIWLRDVGQW